MTDKNIQEYLNSDETLLWSGTPVDFEPKDAVYKPKFTKTLTISIIAAVVIIAAYVAAVLKSSSEVMWIIILLILVFAAIPVLTFNSDNKKLKKKIMYAITDKRLVTIKDAASGVEFDTIKEATIAKDSAGIYTLLCGSEAVNAKETKYRNLAALGSGLVEEGVCRRYAMYGISNPDEVRNILKNCIPIK